MPFTRRKFMIESARLVAAGVAVGPLAAAARLELAAPALGNVSQAELTAAPLSDADYWSFADQIALYFDNQWKQSSSRYDPSGTQYNSALLTTHAIAALAGHDGSARQDERARLLARRLCESPPWVDQAGSRSSSSQKIIPGWTENLAQVDARQHASIDPKVAEALTYAWRARDVIGLNSDDVAMIRDRIDSVARGSFYRYPNVRLNQVNWPAEIYAHAAEVAGDIRLLTDDYRLQLNRFVVGIKRALIKGGSPNLGGSYRFHYLPHKPPDDPLNLDSPEYANIVCHVLLYYDMALKAGMEPLPSEHMALLKAWVERILCGYWTHSGYLNWDTGLSYRRWHLGKYWAFAQQGLLTIAAAHHFRTSEYGEWAKFIFDRGLILYQRFAGEGGDATGLAPPLLYDLNRHYQGLRQRQLFAARVQANAARAVVLGLGRQSASEPPPLYAFDPDIGRLAVTTPAYSTAILPVNQHAVPYGGIELARLHDGGAHLLSNPGGKPWAAFGVVVRDARANTVLKSQKELTELDPEKLPLELIRSPRGPVRSFKPYLRHPHAGSFDRLEAVGERSVLNLRLRTTHRFKRDFIETRWDLIQSGSKQVYTVDVLFPSCGSGAVITAVLQGGEQRALASPGRSRRRVALSRVSFFHVAGEDGSYIVVPVSGHPGAVAWISRPGPQKSVPNPGPTLVVNLAKRSSFRSRSLTVRIAPTGALPDEAAKVARRLRRRRR